MCTPENGFVDNFQILSTSKNTNKLPKTSLILPSQQNFRGNHLSFKSIVILCFKKYQYKYHAPQLSLKPSEIFSIVVGQEYYSKTLGIQIIKPTPVYFIRLKNVLKKHFVFKNGRYSLTK